MKCIVQEMITIIFYIKNVESSLAFLVIFSEEVFLVSSSSTYHIISYGIIYFTVAKFSKKLIFLNHWYAPDSISGGKKY